MSRCDWAMSANRHAGVSKMVASPFRSQRRNTPVKLQPLRNSVTSLSSPTSALALSTHKRSGIDNATNVLDDLTPDAHDGLRQLGFSDERIKRARQYLSDQNAFRLAHTFENVLQALFEIGPASPPPSRPSSAGQIENDFGSPNELSLMQMGFTREQVRDAMMTLGTSSLEQVLEELLSRGPPMVEGLSAFDSVNATVSICEGLDNASSADCKNATPLSDENRLALLVAKIVEKHTEIPINTARHYLLLIEAGVKQNLISSQDRTELHCELERGAIDIVRDFLCIVEVKYTPDIPLEGVDTSWECEICFSDHDTCGWRCSYGHQFCHDCMRHHVDAVAYPTCPFVGCGYNLKESDFIALECDPDRLRAFRESQLQNAVNSLGGSSHYEHEVIIRCQSTECTNAIVVPSSAERSCFKCPCGSRPFCTKCRQAPYHYHVDCEQVQDFRKAWLDWLTEGRTKYRQAIFATSKFSADLQNYEDGMQGWRAQVKALRESMAREKELKRDELWKSKHCRLCPGCNRPLEKMSGCNHMVCGRDAHGGNEQRGCGATFDWEKAEPYKPTLPNCEKELPDQPKVPEKCFSARGVNAFHPFTDCSSCGREGQGIDGLQFRCIHCENYRVCEDCEVKLPRIHDTEHVFEIMYESDFDWSHVHLPVGTAVRIIRSRNGLPTSEPQLGHELEGMTGTILKEVPLIRGTVAHRIAVSRGTEDMLLYEVIVASVICRISSEFLEPLISSRSQAEQILSSQVDHRIAMDHMLDHM